MKVEDFFIAIIGNPLLAASLGVVAIMFFGIVILNIVAAAEEQYGCCKCCEKEKLTPLEKEASKAADDVIEALKRG